jgi:hypothetical protein
MSSQVQYRRGTNAQNIAFTGALAEITVDTTNGTLRVHDGFTPGGSNVATVAYVTAQISALSANSITNGTSSVAVIASGGNIRANVGGSTITNTYASGLEVTGLISATGNISGNFILGNGSQLTGIDATSIQSGTSNVRVASSGGNVTTSVGGTANVVVVSSTNVTITGDLSVTGNATLSGNILGDRIQNGTTTIDIQTASGNANITVGGASNVAVFTTTGANITGSLSATGNISAGNITGNFILGNGSQLTGIDATAIQNGSANVRTFLNGNVTTSAAGTANVLVITGTGANIAGTLNVTGDVTFGGNLIDTGALTISTGSNGNITLSPDGSGVIVANKDIRNGQANGVGNIGATGATFNTVFAKATSAQYADLAENYVADKKYKIGTVLCFGGANEVTESNSHHDTRIAGTVSENPAYLMNSGLASENTIAVALMGRVPCQVVGTINKGDRLVASKIPGVATVLDSKSYQPGCIIGKSLEDYNSDEPGVIEIVVGRL